MKTIINKSRIYTQGRLLYISNGVLDSVDKFLSSADSKINT